MCLLFMHSNSWMDYVQWHLGYVLLTAPSMHNNLSKISVTLMATNVSIIMLWSSLKKSNTLRAFSYYAAKWNVHLCYNHYIFWRIYMYVLTSGKFICPYASRIGQCMFLCCNYLFKIILFLNFYMGSQQSTTGHKFY